MYAILASIALAIYSIILVDFSLLFQEMSVNADMLTSTQALYTAEGVAESTFADIGLGELTTRNMRFTSIADQMKASDSNLGVPLLPYNEGVESFYIQRKLSLSEDDLKASDGYMLSNRAVTSSAYSASAHLAEGLALEKKAYYGLEKRSAGGFAFRQVDNANDFNSIEFNYGQAGEDPQMLFEIFVFPREGFPIDFRTFDQLKEDRESSSVKRFVINTRDDSQSGVPMNGSMIKPDFVISKAGYAKQITVSGFEPLKNNYILHFQTLDNKPVLYKLTANSNAGPVMLPSMMQTIDVIGATPTGLYQRIKVQRQTEQEILPGLNFAHFSDGAINK